MRWECTVWRMGDLRNPYRILVRKSEWKTLMGDLGVDGRIILN
jgi:hypothetical protein